MPTSAPQMSGEKTISDDVTSDDIKINLSHVMFNDVRCKSIVLELSLKRCPMIRLCPTMLHPIIKLFRSPDVNDVRCKSMSSRA